MSITTQYSDWGIESDTSVSIGIGRFGATFAPFKLKGWNIQEEDFDVKYYGIGVGESRGLTLTRRQDMAVSAATEAGDLALAAAAPSGGPLAPVTFAGRTRSAQSFTGFGHLAEFTAATPVGGLSIQILLFNLNLSANAVPTVLDLIVKIVSGELSWSRLNQICPAWAGVVGPTVGLGGGAMLYTGRFEVAAAHTATRRTPRHGVGAGHQTMNRRFRPRP